LLGGVLADRLRPSAGLAGVVGLQGAGPGLLGPGGGIGWVAVPAAGGGGSFWGGPPPRRAAGPPARGARARARPPPRSATGGAGGGAGRGGADGDGVRGGAGERPDGGRPAGGCDGFVCAGPAVRGAGRSARRGAGLVGPPRPADHRIVTSRNGCGGTGRAFFS